MTTRTTRIRRCARAAAALLLAALPLAAPPALASKVEARALIEETADEVISILNDPELDGEGRRERIEKIAYRLFDFELMSKLVLARNWRSFAPEQKKAFVEEFKEHLSRQYGSRIDRYEQEKVEVVGARDEARGDVTVQTKVVGGQFDGTPVDYRLRHRSDDWRIIDVVIEGVSLVSSFRDQFGDTVRREGPEGLLRILREKNAKGEIEGEVPADSG